MELELPPEEKSEQVELELNDRPELPTKENPFDHPPMKDVLDISGVKPLKRIKWREPNQDGQDRAS